MLAHVFLHHLSDFQNLALEVFELASLNELFALVIGGKNVGQIFVPWLNRRHETALQQVLLTDV